MMSSWRSGRVSSWIASSNLPLATITPTSDARPRPRACRAPASAGDAPAASSPQRLDQRGQRPLEVLDRAVVLDHVVGPGRLLLLGELARLALVDQRVPARLGALAPHLVGGDDGDRGVEDPLQLRSRTGAAPRPRRSRSRPAAGPSQAPIRSPPGGGSAPPARSAPRGRRRRSRRSWRGRRGRRAPPPAPQRSPAGRSSGSESSSSWTTASLESVAAPRRSKAARASDFPAAMPPVRPIVSGAIGAAQLCSDWRLARRRGSSPAASSRSSGESGRCGHRFALLAPPPALGGAVLFGNRSRLGVRRGPRPQQAGHQEPPRTAAPQSRGSPRRRR